MPARDGWVQGTAGGDVPPSFFGESAEGESHGGGRFFEGERDKELCA